MSVEQQAQSPCAQCGGNCWPDCGMHPEGCVANSSAGGWMIIAGCLREHDNDRPRRTMTRIYRNILLREARAFGVECAAIVSSARLQAQPGGVQVLQIWNRGALCGELRMSCADGERLCAMLGLEEEVIHD